MKPKYAHSSLAVSRRTNALLLGTAIFLTCSSAQAVDLLNDTFSDNERSTQALPSSAQWFFRNSTVGGVAPNFASGLNAAGGNLDLPYTNAAPAGAASAFTQVAYFTASNAPITLTNTGDTLTYSFSLTLDTISSGDNILRFGLYKSNVGARLTADDNGSTGAPVVPPVVTDAYTGYVSQFNPSTRNNGIYRRNASGSTNQQLVGGSSVPSLLANAVAGATPLVAGTPFTVTFKLEKVATGTQITSTVNGNTRTIIDTATPLETFDTVVIFGATGLANLPAGAGLGVTVDDVVVATNFTPPPPPAEPMKWAIGNGDWNTTSANWQPLAGGAPITYSDGSEVTFNDDFGLTPVAINLTGTRSPATITNNSTRNYTFSGSDISGTTTLAKSGSSTLTLASANTFIGATSLNAGTLVLKDENALASSQLNLAGGTVVFDSSVTSDIFTIGGLSAATSGPSYDIAMQNNAGSPAAIQLNVNGGGTYSGILSGPGLLVKGGTGVLSLTQANTYTGNTILEGTGALRVTNPDALGTGDLFLSSLQTAAGIATFEISGGINFSKPMTIESSTGREHFTSSTGANTLSSTITIDDGGTNPISFDTSGGAGNPFTVSGAINAPFYAGEFTLRGTSGGILSSAIDAPSSTLTFLTATDNVVWTVSGSGSNWGVTRILSAAGPLVGGANQGFSGCKLIIGANDALDPTARILWANSNNNISGSTIDLAGFNQTVAGLDKPFNNSQSPLPAEVPPLPPVPNAIPNITNTSATTDSTLTLADLAADYSYVGTISDGPTRIVSLVLNSAGRIQRLTRALAYTGNTTIVDGTLRVDTPNFANSSTLTIGNVVDSPAVLDLPTAGTDIVALLVIDGQSFTSGEFGNIDSLSPVIPTSAITGAGTITVMPSVTSPYDTWVASYQPGFTLNLPGQDQDGDGLTNQQEFAFGLNPKSGASVSPIVGGLSSGGQFSYTRLASSGLTYRVFTSTTLGGWTLDAGATSSQNLGPVNGSGVQSVAVTLTASPAGGKLFARIEATE